MAAGATLHFVPQSNTAGLPYLGIATEELALGDWVGDITFTLGTVVSPSGSGHFSLWQNGFTPSFFWSTNDVGGTVNADNTLDMAPEQHDHFNYGFSEEGLWSIDITVSGNHVTDGLVSTTETFSFNVVPEPSSALLGTLGALGLLARRRRG